MMLKLTLKAAFYASIAWILVEVFTRAVWSVYRTYLYSGQ